MIAKKIILSKNSVANLRSFEKLKQQLKRKGNYSSLLPLLLAACGGGGGGSSPSPSPNTPTTPTPDFTESPTNTFVARDNNNRTLSQSSATADLIVSGMGGNDTITTGSGADIIEGGAGADTINAGGGDDIIIPIGTTSSNQYSDSAITSPAGVGADLSTLLSLSDINGHGSSDVVIGESLDGGAGNNTLVIYGDVDISGISITNLTTLWVNSELTLTAAQLSSMMTVIGDGSSVLNIVGNASAGIFDQVDLSALELTGISSITSDGNVELLLSDASQLAGISEIMTTSSLVVTISGNATINASDLAGIIASGAHIEVAEGSTLVLDTVDAVTSFGNFRLGGDGTIVVADAVIAVADSLSGVRIDDDVNIVDTASNSIIIESVGGVLVSDIDPGDSRLPRIDYAEVEELKESDVETTIVFTLNEAHFKTVTFDYTGPNDTSGTITFNPGETTTSLTVNWADDDIEEDDVYYSYSFSNAVNGIINNQWLDFRIRDDDGLPEISVEDVLAFEVDGTVSFTANLSEAWDETISFYYSDLNYQQLYKVTFAPGETSVTFSLLLEENNTLDVSQTIELVHAYNATFEDDSTATHVNVNYIDNDGLDSNGSPDITDNKYTDVVLAVGDTLESSISMRADRDWIAIDLVAGQIYEVNVSSSASTYYLGASLMDPDGIYASGNIVTQTVTDHNRRLVIEPDESGTYFVFIGYSSDTDGIDYSISLAQLDTLEPDGAADTFDGVNTTTSYAVGDTHTGSLYIDGDEDWFQVSLEANTIYEFIISGTEPAIDSEYIPYLNTYDSQGGYLYLRQLYDTSVTSYRDEDGNTHVFISIEQDATIYLAALSLPENYGNYTITSQIVSSNEPDGSQDLPASTSTTAKVSLDGTYQGNISYSDEFDWIAMDMVEGQTYRIDVTGLASGNGSLAEVEIPALYDSSGNVINNPWTGNNITDRSILGTGEAQVYWTATATGTYYISVGGYSNVGSYQVALTEITSQEPDGGEDFASDINTRAVLDIGSSIMGQMDLDTFPDESGNNSGDWIKVSLEAGKIYTFTLSGFEERAGTQDSSTGRLWLFLDDGSSAGNYAYDSLRPITYQAEESGSYYIRVTGDVGSYTLSAEEVDTSEPDGSADATEWYDSTALAVVDTDYTGTISHDEDVDWVGVSLQAGQIYQVEISGSESLANYALNYINYEAEGVVGYIFETGTGEDTIVVSFEAEYDGMHFLQISNDYYYLNDSNTGDYTVRVDQITDEDSDGTPDIGDTFFTAQPISDAETITSTLAYGGDDDWFSVDMTAGEVWSFNVNRSPESTLSSFSMSHIYNASGDVFNLTSVINSQTRNFIAPADGTYFIPIEGSDYLTQGDYEFTATNNDLSELDGSDDYGDSRELATSLVFDTVVTGSLGYSDDVDWFQLNVIAGQAYSIGIDVPEGSNLDLASMSLYGPHSSLGSIHSNENQNVYTFQASEDGVYSFSVRSNFQTGTYTITTSSIDSSEPDGLTDLTENSTTRSTLAVGATFEGSISFADDIDWIAVELIAGQTYSFEVTGGGLVSTGIDHLYDSAGDIVYYVNGENNAWVAASGVDANGGISNQITYTPEISDTYYIQVSDQYGSATGTYSVSMTRIGEDEPDGTFDYSAWLDTTASISMNETVTGSIGVANDRDWFAVTLEAGHIYFFTMKGDASGVGTLIDPRIAGLYNSEGIAIAGAFNDDGFGSSRESAMLFTVSESGTYYIAADGWNAETGTYEIAVSDMTDLLTGSLPYGPTNSETFTEYDLAHLSLDFRIDSLLGGSLYTSDPSGITTTVTYSFPSSNEFYSEREWFGYGERGGPGEPWTDFQALTMDQQESYRGLIEYVDTLINVSFVEVMDVEFSAGTIRVAWSGIDVEEGLLAWGYYPGNTGPISGDIWLFSENLQQAQSADPGTYLYTILLHETGHALGLKHPFEGGTTLPSYYDGYEYTVMAYNITTDNWSAYSADLFPQTYMYFDILALQHLYGAINVNVGDDVYTFDGNERYYLTMWDNDGNDTIEVINQSRGVTINLSGGWLDVGTTITYQTDDGPLTKTDTVYLPEEISIENAYGADHNDSIIGSSMANDLRGLNGDDTLDGREGADTLTGGLGADIFVTRSGDGNTILSEADLVLDFTDGEDLIGLNGLTFDDLSISAGSGDYAEDTLIQVTSTGEYLMVLDGVDVSLVNADDFTTIADEWWLA